MKNSHDFSGIFNMVSGSAASGSSSGDEEELYEKVLEQVTK